jgi:hypothetical protein
MKIDFVVLADAAQAVGGKLFILGGGWSIFRAASFPAPVQIALAINVSFTSTEIGIRFPVNIVIADEAGVPIIPEIKGQVETGQVTPDMPKGIGGKLPLAVNVGVNVPRAGKYAIMVSVGSSKLAVYFDAIFVGQRVQFGPEGGPIEPRN